MATAQIPGEPPHRFHFRLRDWVLALGLAIFCYATAWVHIQKTPLGKAPDEMAHLTYVAEIASGDRLIPDYANSIRLPRKVQGNYLGHPPLYYTTLGLLGRAMDWDAISDYRKYRAVSAAMVALGMLLWAMTARALGLPATWIVVTVAASCAVPMFPYLAGSINNDNMALLGVAVASFGLATIRHWPRLSWYVAALGLLIALLVKATAALFVLAFFAAWGIAVLRSGERRLPSRDMILALGLVCIVAGAYYVCTVLAHGTPFPRAARIYAGRLPPENPMSLLEFAWRFVQIMLRRLPSIMSFASLKPITPALLPWFYAMLAMPVVALALTLFGRRRSPHARLINAFFLALVATIVLHIVFVWRGYLGHGLLAGIQPRYYNYALPGLFVLGYAHATAYRASRALFAAFCLLVALVLGLTPMLTAQAQLAAQAHSTLPSAATPLASDRSGSLRYQPPAASTEFRRMPVMITSQAGRVDRIAIDGRVARIKGWAIERRTRTAAGRIFVFAGGSLVGAGTTGRQRPDVAKALASPMAGLAGFEITVRDIPAQFTACDFEIAAEQSDGRIVVLPAAACAAP